MTLHEPRLKTADNVDCCRKATVCFLHDVRSRGPWPMPSAPLWEPDPRTNRPLPAARSTRVVSALTGGSTVGKKGYPGVGHDGARSAEWTP